MQPFDGDEFDKRFDEIYKPAIEEAGFEPYRVDRDPSASIPIANIETGIKDSDVCFADISIDNPNVWFELGYAICANKPMCLVCWQEREKFPFDVQHRKIIRYKKGSPSDFNTLRLDIVERLKAIQEKNESIEVLIKQADRADQGHLSPMEFSALCVAFENIDSDQDAASLWVITNDMERLGYTKLATKAAMIGLLNKAMVKRQNASDGDGNMFYVYNLTAYGEGYIMNNLNKIQLRREGRQSSSFARSSNGLDDEIPF